MVRLCRELENGPYILMRPLNEQSHIGYSLYVHLARQPHRMFVSCCPSQSLGSGAAMLASFTLCSRPSVPPSTHYPAPKHIETKPSFCLVQLFYGL